MPRHPRAPGSDSVVRMDGSNGSTRIAAAPSQSAPRGRGVGAIPRNRRPPPHASAAARPVPCYLASVKSPSALRALNGDCLDPGGSSGSAPEPSGLPGLGGETDHGIVTGSCFQITTNAGRSHRNLGAPSDPSPGGRPGHAHKLARRCVRPCATHQRKPNASSRGRPDPFHLAPQGLRVVSTTERARYPSCFMAGDRPRQSVVPSARGGSCQPASDRSGRAAAGICDGGRLRRAGPSAAVSRSGSVVATLGHFDPNGPRGRRE